MTYKIIIEVENKGVTRKIKNIIAPSWNILPLEYCHTNGVIAMDALNIFSLQINIKTIYGINKMELIHKNEYIDLLKFESITYFIKVSNSVLKDIQE